jgi:DNA-binding LacI/PurR family transcriptional regulator
MTTVRDIAALVGVSTATVSRVLNESSAVSPQTKIKVKLAMEELGYEKRILNKKRTNLFGVIFPNISNPFFAELLDVIEKEAYYHGRCVLFFNSRQSTRLEKIYLHECENHQVDGVFLVSTSVDDEHMTMVKSLPYPTVLLTKPTTIIPSVSVHHAKGGRMIAEHLISSGHTQIGYVGPINAHEEKLIGFKQYLEEMREPLQEKFMADDDADDVARFVDGLLDEHGKPKVSAIFCVNDVVAEKVIKLMDARHVNIPDELVIVGFDNSITAKSLNLSSVSQPMREIAHIGFESMLECLKATEKQENYSPKVLLPRLVLRNSVLEIKED